MILQLASRHCRKIAGFYLFVFYLSVVLPLGARSMPVNRTSYYGGSGFMPEKSNMAAAPHKAAEVTNKKTTKAVSKKFIGGPSQPEMSSFKSVNANNLVNLFTGDFSYNIPLLDVGGYPINIYYSGGITPEQEASWVGLGWNINPGNVNRNMRGIPDDFNGEDKLTQEQQVKPNKTWGANIGADAELMGIKIPVSVELGAEFNNHLGPALNAGIRGSASLFSIAKFSGNEKFGASLAASANWGIDINSRAGASFSGGVSLGAAVMYKNMTLNGSAGVSTSYNSRSGIKALNIHEQVFFNQIQSKELSDRQNEMIKESFKTNGLGGVNYTAITFAKPSYLPIIRMPITNTAWSARLQVGTGAFGGAVDVEAEVYGQKSEVAPSDVSQTKPMVGYLYYQNAENHPEYVMDFTRFNDREVTPNTKVISVPQYTYDVFAIQGEGTGGNIRAYRYDLGYVRDNITTSKDKNTSGGGDVDLPGHFGANLQTINTPSTTGEWKNGNKLRGLTGFTKPKTVFGSVYFRNPGEATVSPLGRFDNVGGTNLVRYALGGTGQAPTIEPRLDFFAFDSRPVRGNGPQFVSLAGANANFVPGASRSQVISFLTAEEASNIGLDRDIKCYDNVNFLDNVKNTLLYYPIKRVDADGKNRKKHHISQINVTESDGKRYVYGIPVYNIKQKDFTFSVNTPYTEIPDQIKIENGWASTSSPMLDQESVDGYVQISTMPAYAHSFLLSGILSPDYVDVTNDGITEDDLGKAVKFNYSKIKEGNDSVYKWRTPHTTELTGNFNAENRSEKKDDKAMISYGERESWYLHSVESKNMIALFFVKNRYDGKGTVNEYGGINNSNFLKALDRISLYSKADLLKNGLAKARPIKTVHFDYTWELCKNTPDNNSGLADNGKLTLKGIYFTFNGKENKKEKSRYMFSYGNNPGYAVAEADRWGTYKPADQNPGGLKNRDYPYTIQDKTTSGNNAAAWALKTITLPSGGQIEVNYESDDYAWVQNKRAAMMMNVAGFGNSNDFSKSTNRLYPSDYFLKEENNYVFIRVPEACVNPGDSKMYLEGIKQLAFKIWVGMPKGAEYIPCYANFGEVEGTDYGVDGTDKNIIWVKMKPLGGKSPLSITTLEYLRQQLPGQAFKGYDIQGEPALKQVGDMLIDMVHTLRDAFTDPVLAFRKDAKAQNTDLSKCFVRLNAPKGYKYGGGYRVESVVLRDNWNTMTNQYTASYGQKYNYETTETFNGKARTISSGVASYEPSIGGEENPWQSIINIEDDLPMGPTSYGAVEMPVLDAFFPSSVVGYSKVTVTSIHAGTTGSNKSRSGIGRQVTEFYTAKDYPVSYSYTPTDVKEFHQNSSKEFLKKYAYDYKAQSQGFLVATNDMHGKMRSQTSYAETDPESKISYTENFYRNTGENGLNEQFAFVDSYNNTVFNGNMGVDIELMTDAREFSVKGTSRDHQANVDIFYILGVPIPIPTYWQINGTTENIYRAVTATKVVNYHAVLDRTVVMDKGSKVETQNMAYDAETGQVLVSRTNNEFNMPVYNTKYPAYWAYSGMGPANKNIDATAYSRVDFIDGRIYNNPGIPIESGDELYILDPGNATSCPLGSSADTKLIWAYDKNRDNSAINSGTPDLVFMDKDGLLYNRTGVIFRIIRSGRRNMLEQSVAAITSMDNPLASGTLSFANAQKVINASAVEYREKWQTDNDQFKRYREDMNPATCAYQVTEDPNGYLQKNVNPYQKGLLGNFHSWRSMVFYDGRKAADFNNKTNIADNGFLLNFKPYWIKQPGYMLPDVQNKQWVWNSKLNMLNTKGLELETMDPLGIYTSVQYGYNKTIPVAMANNARYYEMFAEGFEDYSYGESLNSVQFNGQAKKHIDFYGFANSRIVDRNMAPVTPHSGKYMMEVYHNSTMVKHVNLLQTAVPEDYSLPFTRMVPNRLAERGMNTTITWQYPDDLFTYPFIVQYSGDAGMDLTLNLESYTPWAHPEGYFEYEFDLDQYIEITEGGTFNYYTEARNYYLGNVPAIVPASMSVNFTPIEEHGGYINFEEVKLISEAGLWRHEYRVCLPKGIYKVTGHISVTATDYNINQQLLPWGGYKFHFFNNPPSSQVDANGDIAGYKSLSTLNTCQYDQPIVANENMYHPGFSAPPNKKMLLSAWVHETCGDAANGIPCKEYTYTHSQVQVKFQYNPAQTVTMNPVGPIIDGWQRIEGEFTTPAGIDDMTLNFINNSTNSIYFDDIRIHPYNANMTSYVYDPVNLRLTAELDANNYATFYEYDEEGTLIRKKMETKEGIKTITETRSAIQTSVKQ
ncbi:hypothetical protein A4H97_08855 [Niastella yeongjuensis]|uniref:PA14 domain-containing protein n=1 Tax=Niastella yeongjuensis TaxID=354355 RepID=A0A1V9EEX4_9BACT|nr:hypothetical protein [Niastella yeongjuensis]OQP44475.1 hypothetical protein A4H97_08855 [Niastella yeongjuensis]SEO86356.1 hypothetical protein SAMN05660816_03775 [Niastella yeongjuensis]